MGHQMADNHEQELFYNMDDAATDVYTDKSVENAAAYIDDSQSLLFNHSQQQQRQIHELNELKQSVAERDAEIEKLKKISRHLDQHQKFLKSDNDSLREENRCLLAKLAQLEEG